MSETTINIAKDFTDSPGARYFEDGEHSGQEFRDNILVKAYEEYDIITVILDGTEGYATSFLEESFGGLARKFGKKEVLKKLKFISHEEPSLIDEITEYINDT